MGARPEKPTAPGEAPVPGAKQGKRRGQSLNHVSSCARARADAASRLYASTARTAASAAPRTPARVQAI